MIREAGSDFWEVIPGKKIHVEKQKKVSDNMWYAWSKLISEGGIKQDKNLGIPGKSIREFPGSLYENSGKQSGIAATLYLMGAFSGTWWEH